MTQHLLSFSQLQSWATCGERYRLEKFVRVPGRPSWATIGGSTVHTLTEEHDLRTLGVDVPERTWAEVFEHYTVAEEERSGKSRDEFRASGRASAKYPNKEDPDFWATEGPAMVNRWITWRRGSTWEVWTAPDGTLGVEFPFWLALGDDADADVVRGSIDRVMVTPDGDLVVVDLKSGASTPASPKQLAVYARALEHLQGVDVPYGTFWDARKGGTGLIYPLASYTAEGLGWEFGALAFARENNLFLPAPSNLCGSCSVREWCREVGGERAHEVPAPWEPLRQWEGE